MNQENIQTRLSSPEFNGCGCSFCKNVHDHDSFSNDPILLKDLAVLSGGGGSYTPPVIGVNNAAELIHGNEWGPGGGTPVSLTYSFVNTVPSYYPSNALEQNLFSAFTPSMQNAVRGILSDISTFTNITFTEVSGVGDVTYGQAYLTTTESDPLAYAYFPDQGNFSGDVWFNNRYDFSSAMDPGEVGYFIAMHETGHALGLIHSFTAGLTGSENTEQYSVMAYDINPWGSISAETFMLYDVSALQAIYGANTSFNSGDTVYALDPTKAYTVWDGGGNDTFDASVISTDSVIRLEEGGFSSVGLTDHIAVAYGAIIENAVTGSGNDTIYGNAYNNTLEGGAGNDNLYGYDGDDTYIYESGIDDIFETAGLDRVVFDSVWHPSDVSIVGDILTLVDNVHEIIFDDIDLIEFFSFDSFADMTLNELMNFGVSVDDTFFGTSAIETFNGFDGVDTVDYSASTSAVNIDLLNNTASGGDAQGDTLISIENITGSDSASARDYIFGDANANTILGLNGADILEGGAGADIIDGGDGWDYSRYTRSASGVNINLETGVNTGGDAQGDVILNVEAIVGSQHNDTLIGGTSNDHLRGENGDDTLSGGLGADQLYGGNGDDVFIYTAGRDRIFETGSDVDRVVFDAQWAIEDVSIIGNQMIFNQGIDFITFNDINLIEFFAFNGFADMTLLEVENYLASLSNNENGTSGNDVFIGDATSQTFNGFDGVDTVDYSASTSAVNIDLLNNTASGGDAQGDALISIENITGSDSALARDYIFGDANANTILGLNGADILEGGAGADIIDGGDGWDYSRYTRSASGVNINLETGVNTGGDAQGDVILNVEAIVGSQHNDTLIGGISNDHLRGEHGDDTLSGGLGADQLYGGNGDDVFMFHAVSAFDRVDTIFDFDLLENDSIDVSDVLQGYDAVTDAIADFVQITESGGNTILSVDADGGADQFLQIVTIRGLHGMTDEDALEASGNLVTV